MRWYFSLSEASIDRADHGWRGLVRVAVLSAIRNTALRPYLIYDGGESAFTAELQAMGVTVLYHRVSFFDALPVRYDASSIGIARGAFLRTELPLLETEEEFVLYTDCDVIFRRHPQIATRPTLFAAAPESSRTDYDNDMNTGVLWLNVPAMRATLPDFTQFIREHLHDGWPGCDQAHFRRFYAGKWDRLDLRYNWKPYWGDNPDAAILHWHGPKPIAVRKLINTPDLRTDVNWGRLFRSEPRAYGKYLAEWETLARETTRVVFGTVDRFDDNKCGGWVLYEETPDDPVKFTLEIDGEKRGQVVCDEVRTDLAVFGATRAGGFSIDLPTLAPGDHRLRLLSDAGTPHTLLWRGTRLDTFDFNVAAKVQPQTPGHCDIVVQIDEIGPAGARGWALDRARPNEPTTIELLVDGEMQTRMRCDTPRPDVKETGQPERVGFAIPLDRRYFDDRPRQITFRAAEGGRVTVQHGGKDVPFVELRQKWRPKIISHIDGVREGVIKGWILVEDPATKERTGGAALSVTCDGQFVGMVRATAYRPDVAKHYSGAAECGLEFLPPPHFRRARPQAFRFFLMPYDVEIEGSPCVTSFVSDSQAAALDKIAEEVDQLYRQASTLRRSLRLIISRPVYTLDDYSHWATEYFGSLRRDAMVRRRADARVSADQDSYPLVSVICPVYRPDIGYFTEAVESVIAQTYPAWELILVDDGSQDPALTEAIEELARRDRRIRVVPRPKNGGISAATNTGIKAAQGRWVALFDHDDLLVDVALEVMVGAALRTGAKILYSDEDKIDEAGVLSEPAFKPDWNYRLLLSVNYVCHLLMVDRATLRKAGALNARYDGAQDHALLLRLAELVPGRDIHHVPEVLYHWRKSATSTAASTSAKPEAVESGRLAVADHLKRRGHEGASVIPTHESTWYRVDWGRIETPKVSIIIPFKDAIATTRECVTRVFEQTEYANLEIILVDNWSVTEEAAAFCAEMRARPDVRVLRIEEEFNYSRLNNIAAGYSDAEYLVLMNNDLFVTHADWLRILVNEALADDTVGIVGGKYLYPNGTIQHAGVVLGIGGVAAHVHSGLPAASPGYAARALFAQEMSAVTAACLLIRADVFREVDGLDEDELRVAFNDVDLCLKVRSTGYKVIWTPDFVADHHESLSRGGDEEQEAKETRFFDEFQAMMTRWGDVLRRDPFYSKHFALDGRAFYDLVPPSPQRRRGHDPRPGMSVAAQ